MLVRVDVADSEPARLNTLYLGNGLGLDLLFANTAAQQVTQKASHCGPEYTAWAEQGGHVAGVQAGRAVDQYHVAANSQRRLGKGKVDRGREVTRSGHQGGGAEGARLLKLNDRAVDAGRETKVVRVDDQTLHCRQCTKRLFFFSRIQGGSWQMCAPGWGRRTNY